MPPAKQNTLFLPVVSHREGFCSVKDRDTAQAVDSIPPLDHLHTTQKTGEIRTP